MQYGFWSVVPPILTIVLALVTKNVFFSLLIGIFTSSMVLCGGSPLTGLNDAFYSFIHTFESSGNTITLISFLLDWRTHIPYREIRRRGGVYRGHAEEACAYQDKARREYFYLASWHNHLYFRVSQLYG